jgi:thiamine biosynthesis protein ThiS
VEIKVDGLSRQVPDRSTVSEVLGILGEPETYHLVEVNGQYIHPRDYATTRLQEGDRLEIIYPAFGG